MIQVIYKLSPFGDLYCINHHYALTNYVGSDTTLSENVDIDETYSTSLDSMVDQAIDDFKDRHPEWNEEVRALILEPQTVRTLTSKDGNRSDDNEAALYAFAERYYQGSSSPNGYVQNSIWEYLNQTDTKTSLYEAAMYYQTWCSINKVNLQSDSTRAKSRINGSDYIVGPFRISYNEADFDIIHYSEKPVHTITDQSGNAIPGAQLTNSNGVSIGDTIPNNENFYVKFPYSEQPERLDINVSIDYINEVTGEIQDIKTYSQKFKIDGTVTSATKLYEIWHSGTCPFYPNDRETNDWGGGCSDCGASSSHYGYSGTVLCYAVPDGGPEHGRYQDMRKIVKGLVEMDTANATLTVPLPHKDMDIEGDVWEDVPQGKDQVINGLKDNQDKLLEGIEVRLYKADGTLAEVRYGTNPTLTDANGHYKFLGVNPTYKYFVVFTYDGTIYTNTYGAGVPEYNTPAWNASSKGSEIVNERESLNKRFVTISSYPAMYRTTAIFSGNYLHNGYNNIYSINDSVLQSYKNKVTEQLRSYLSTHNRLEDADYINNIYIPIINNSSDQTEAKNVLQYIWDCRVRAYAGDESEQDGKTLRAGGKYYPYYDRFALMDSEGNRLTADNATTNYDGYRMIYNGQLHINLGLLKRPTTDLQLEEDLYKTVVSINGQDETYEYDTFSKKGLKINAADAMISQNIATGDYDYKTNSKNLSSDLNLGGIAEYPTNYAPIEIYATYRINIKNNSYMPTSVNEIAAYIDPKFYSYSDSYTTTAGMTIKGIEGTFLYPDSDTTVSEKSLTDYDSNSLGLRVNTNSKYGTASETGKFMGTDLYISFDKEVILEQNQMVAVYITYRLGENSTTNPKFNCTYNSTQPGGENHAYAILQDLFRNVSEKKIYVYTRAEINAYSTFFKKDTDTDTTRTKYASYYTYSSPLQNGFTYRAAGIYDAMSMPGNLNAAELDTKTEDDWDKASTFVLMDTGSRSIAGNAWETVGKPANEWAGINNVNNYPKFDSQYPIKGITVELVEIKDGQEYVRGRTVTSEDGSYKFIDYIPGLYTVRFLYGDSAKYNTEQYSNYTKFTLNNEQYKCAYNGQFYQSALANPNTNDNRYWYAQDQDNRYSDAYDEVTIRKAVNELLQTYSYNDVVKVVKNPTDYMVYAYTSLLDIEVEKAKETTLAQNPSYQITNIDFALTPRTESKLTMNKEVTHLKLILQNGTVQFDADTETIRKQGVPAVVQAAQGNDINISMSSELVNGATLEITYTLTITNDGPEDTVTYYKDTAGNIIALGLYKEDPRKIVYYEDEAIRTYSNNGTFQRNPDTTWVSKISAGTTTMKELNASKTQTIETTTKADLVADFVSSNLTFAKVNYTGAVINEGWDLYTGTKEDFDKNYYKEYDNQKELEPRISKEMDSSEVYDSNVIVLANNQNKLVKPLKSGESVSENIVLSKVISVNDSSTDTKSYTNKARILRINNTVSRIQDMGAAGLVHKTEHVTISDPTGIGNSYIGIILILVVAVVIAIGVVLIKKFVISKR